MATISISLKLDPHERALIEEALKEYSAMLLDRYQGSTVVRDRQALMAKRNKLIKLATAL